MTLLPALALLAIGTPPTATLVLSQVVLSFGIPFAVVPLIRLNSDPAVMGEYVAGRSLRIAGLDIGRAGDRAERGAARPDLHRRQLRRRSPPPPS